MTTKHITVRIPDNLLNVVEAIAKKTKSSRSKVLIHFLDKGLNSIIPNTNKEVNNNE